MQPVWPSLLPCAVRSALSIRSEVIFKLSLRSEKTFRNVIFCHYFIRSCSTKSEVKQPGKNNNLSKVHKALFELAGYGPVSKDEDPITEANAISDASNNVVDNSFSETNPAKSVDSVYGKFDKSEQQPKLQKKIPKVSEMLTHHVPGQKDVQITTKVSKGKGHDTGGAHPDSGILVGLCSRHKQSIYDDSKNSDSNMILWNKLQHFEKMKKYEIILDVFERSDFAQQDLSIWPSRLIAGTILHSCLQVGDYVQLLNLYEEFLSKGLEPGEGIYVTLIKCLSKLKKWDRAMELIQVG